MNEIEFEISTDMFQFFKDVFDNWMSGALTTRQAFTSKEAGVVRYLQK